MIAAISSGNDNLSDWLLLLAIVLFVIATVAATGKAAILTSYAIACGWLGLAVTALALLVA